MKSPGDRLYEIVASLPTEQRVGIALALADLSQALLSLKPKGPSEDRSTRIAQLELQLKGNPQLVSIICMREQISRATYFREKKKLEQRRASLKVSLNAMSGETSSA